ncbi:type II secretion system protein [Chloracidobacterium validum]|uniref:Type II secretion system protein n=1 Tax=Chloracidobacterium validum TaxID=2821543 RepID=A0ABX8B6H1_9BACT|nr:type II secretion system protein [Chloracidobacterium validum]QUW02254.1 type II secretion system protein [Chloracidobacterium validum]
MQRTGHRLYRQERGYSLIEIIVVAALIGILAAISGIFVISYRKSVAADSAGSDLAAAIRETRATAMGQRNTYQMILFRRPTENSDGYVVIRYTNNALNVTTDTGYTTTATLISRNSLPTDYRFQRFTESGAGVITPPPTILSLPELPFTTNTFTFLTERGVDLGMSGPSAILTFKSDGSIINTPPNADPTSNLNNVPFNGVIFLSSDIGDPATRSRQARALTILGLTGRVTMWKNAGGNAPGTGIWVSGSRQASE